MKFFDKLIEGIDKYGTIIGSIALTIVMLIITSNVIVRIFGGILAGTYDLIEITIVVCIAFALASTEKNKRHTVVDMLTLHMPKRVQLNLENFNYLISIVFWGVVAVSSGIVAYEKAQKGEYTDLLRISIIPFRIFWVIGLTIICIMIIWNTKNNILELWRKK